MGAVVVVAVGVGAFVLTPLLQLWINRREQLARRACAAVVVAVAILAATGHSAATGSSTMDTLLRVAVAAAGAAGGAVAAPAVLGVSAVVGVGALVAGSSPRDVAVGVAVGVLASTVLSHRRHRGWSPPGAIVGGALGLFALDIHGIGRTGVPSLLALLIVGPLAIALWGQLGDSTRRWLAIAAAVSFGVALSATAAGAYSALSARSSISAAIDDARGGLADAKDSDRRASAIAQLQAAHVAFANADRRLDHWWLRVAEAVPVAGRYVHSGRQLVASGSDLSTRAASAVEAADPDQLRPDGGQMDIGALDRLARGGDLASRVRHQGRRYDR